MATGDGRHQEWSALLGARKELGDEYDQAFVESVVERVTSEIDERVDMRIAQVSSRSPMRSRSHRGGTFLALSSLTLGIPISSIAGNFGHLPGLAVAWGGIVLVNLANAWRPGDRQPVARRR